MDEDAREGIRRDRKFKCMLASEWEIKYLNIGRKNMKMSFFTYIFIFLCMCACVCARACVRACVRGGGVLCCGLGSKLLASHHGGPAFIPGQCMWVLWWTEWQCDRFFSKYFGYPLSVQFYQCSVLVLHSPTTNTMY
jgi:hypothetical protein